MTMTPSDYTSSLHIRLPEAIDGEVLKSLLDVLIRRGFEIAVFVSRYNQEGEVDGISLSCMKKEE